MRQKIIFEINGWSYKISLEDDFATYLQSKISKDFSLSTPNSRKAIIHAYIKAQYELFRQEQEIEEIINNLSEGKDKTIIK